MPKNGKSFLCVVWSSGVVPKKWYFFSVRFVELWRGTKKSGRSFHCVWWGCGAVPKQRQVFSLHFLELWRGIKKAVNLFFTFCEGLARYKKSGRSFLYIFWSFGVVPKRW